MEESFERKRHRFVSTLFLLGMFLVLPFPSESLALEMNVLIGALNVCVLMAAAMTFFGVYVSGLLVYVSLCLAIVLFFKSQSFLALIFVTVYLLWNSIKVNRLIKENKWGPLKSLLILSAVYSFSNAWAQNSLAKPEAELPKHLTGYQMRDITSCGLVDQIPWKFRPDGKKVRLLVKDTFRFQSEAQFADWELFQIMDSEGLTSAVFRRTLANGRAESLIVKDAVYNRVLETAKGSKTVEVQDLRSLVNRQALTFFHQDGSTIVYSPGSVGRSALVFQQGTANGGRLLAPVYLRGNYCDRPEDEENSDKQIKKTLKSTGETTQGSTESGGTQK
jgi:hypothetical protein